VGWPSSAPRPGERTRSPSPRGLPLVVRCDSGATTRRAAVLNAISRICRDEGASSGCGKSSTTCRPDCPGDAGGVQLPRKGDGTGLSRISLRFCSITAQWGSGAARDSDSSPNSNGPADRSAAAQDAEGRRTARRCDKASARVGPGWLMTAQARTPRRDDAQQPSKHRPPTTYLQNPRRAYHAPSRS
jgi:hypothetical protein